jgi:hypothetical protein
LLIHCWQPIKIYFAIFTIFKTSRKQIRRGRQVIFPFSSTCALAGLSGAKPEGFTHRSRRLERVGFPLRFTSHFGFVFGKHTHFRP